MAGGEPDPFEGLDEFGTAEVHYFDRMRSGAGARASEEAAPRPYQPHFKIVYWSDIGSAEDLHQWVIKNVISAGELSMIAGASQAGKSFLVFELAMCICRGTPFLGNKVLQCGAVVYQAGEGYRGLRHLRIRAYQTEHGLDGADDVPFALIGSPVDLFSNDADTGHLIADIKHAAEKLGAPLVMVVIDTIAAATPGADEIASKDMSKVLQRCDRIRAETGAAVLLVHHLNAGGEKARGWTGLTANIETQLIVRKLEDMHDANGRTLREVEVFKQKEGEAGRKLRFVLRGVEIDRDQDGEPVTSCVVAPPANIDPGEGNRPSPKGLKFSPQAKIMLECIERAILKHPVDPPSDCEDLPPGMGGTTDPYVRKLFLARLGDGGKEDHEARLARVRKAWERHSQWLAANGLIVLHHRYVWRTKKALRGSIWDPDREEDVTATVTPSDEGKSTESDMPF